MPTALGAHLAQLRQAIPGNSGHAQEGPGSAEEAAFLARAYPASDIALSKIENAKSAFTKAKGRPFPSGKGKKGTWTLYGPSEALYPFTELRNATNYVPNKYVAAGRTTVLAMEPVCKPNKCRLYAAAAGGGLWRAKNATKNNPKWEFLSADFGIQAISSITFDPNNEDTIWVGTGEANASGDSAAGVGIYKSTNGGDSWTGPLGASVFNSRAVGTIAVQPGNSNIVYAGSTRAVRGISSVSGGAVSVIPGAAQWGLYKSTDGGQSWTFVHNGSTDESQCNLTATDPICSQRGVRRVMIDPSSPTTVYAGVVRPRDLALHQRGRRLDADQALAQRGPEHDPSGVRHHDAARTARRACTCTRATSAHRTRRLFRSDDVATGAPVFTDLTSANPADPGYGTYNVCTGQCWYDIFVHTPKGYPDIVYVGGSYSYGETFGISNGRGVVLSTDAGVTSTDMTMDATDLVHPNGLHPDQHHLVTSPDDPFQFFEANDGGVMRSNGKFADASGFCAPRGITGVTLTRCQQLLSRVPDKLEGINDGMPTLQFMSLSVSPFNSKIVQGGTQDNGTWETHGQHEQVAEHDDRRRRSVRLRRRDAELPLPHVLRHVAGGELRQRRHRRLDLDRRSDLRTGNEPVLLRGHHRPGRLEDDVRGQRPGHLAHEDARRSGTGRSSEAQRDLQHVDRHVRGGVRRLGADRLGASLDLGRSWRPRGRDDDRDRADGGRHVDRLGGNVDGPRLRLEERRRRARGSRDWTRRRPTDDAGPLRRRGSTSTRRTGTAPGSRTRATTRSTPTTPGHVFEVVFNPAAGTATWTNKSFDLGDLPITDVVVDGASGDIYASNDFGVLRLAQGTSTWTAAAPGMPNVEVAGLTIRREGQDPLRGNARARRLAAEPRVATDPYS